MLTNSFTPVESYLLTENAKYEFIDILALVICELLTNEILSLEYRQVDRRLEAFLFRQGVNFKTAHKRPVDKLFTEIFSVKGESAIRANELFYYAIEHASDKANLIRLGLKSPRLSKLVRFKRLYSLFGRISLNQNGSTSLSSIKEELSAIRSKLDVAINQQSINHKEILSLLKHRHFYFQEYKVDQIFGSKYGTHLQEYKLSGYDIQHELNFDYFRQSLKMAHVDLYKLKFMQRKYEESQTEIENDDMFDFD